MASLAERVDAIVGIDTHRDTHEAEIANAAGTAIATVQISNDSAGFTALLAWIAERIPGPRIVVSVEGTRSYGIGLARALTAAGMLVLGASSQPTSSDVVRASPIRSTRTWPCWLRCVWTLTGYPHPEPTATGRRCVSCSAPGRTSSPRAPRRPTGCGPCCCPGTTATGKPRAASSLWLR